VRGQQPRKDALEMACHMATLLEEAKTPHTSIAPNSGYVDNLWSTQGKRI